MSCNSQWHARMNYNFVNLLVIDRHLWVSVYFHMTLASSSYSIKEAKQRISIGNYKHVGMRWDPWGTRWDFLDTWVSLFHKGSHETVISELIHIFERVWSIIEGFPELHWSISAYWQKHIINWMIAKLPYNILVGSENSNAMIFSIRLWVKLFRRLRDFPNSYDSFLSTCINEGLFGNLKTTSKKILNLLLLDLMWQQTKKNYVLYKYEEVQYSQHHSSNP